MTKFKFGDKVWHEKFGIGVVISNLGQEDEREYINVAYEDYKGTEYVEYTHKEKLTKVSEWIACIEQMPENGDVLWCYNSTVAVGCHNQYIGGDEILVSGGGYLLVDDMSDAMWMPLPEMPKVTE